MSRRKDVSHASKLHVRLAQLLEDHTQAEISARTGTSEANISRYLSGSRIPGQFCVALAEGLGVNPNWLLLGEGARYLSDVGQEASKMAGNMLELMKAMNAIMHTRVGAVRGKRHLGVLRELNDALLRYEALREKLNSYARPLFAELTDALEVAIKRRNLEHAGDLRVAAEQVSRLCNAPELMHRFHTHQATLEILTGNVTEGVRHQRELLRDAFAECEINSVERLNDFLVLAVGLTNVGQSVQARRIADAAFALATSELESSETYASLRFVQAAQLIDHGRLFEGLRILQHYLPALRENQRPMAWRYIRVASIMAGLTDLSELLELGKADVADCLRVFQLAMWQENEKQLKTALAQMEQFKDFPSMRRPLVIARSYLDAVQHGKGDEGARVWNELPSSSFTPTFEIYAAQVALAAGNRRDALNYLKAAHKRMRDGEDVRNIQVLTHATMLRCAWRLGARFIKKDEIRRWFDETIEAGYVILRGWDETPE